MKNISCLTLANKSTQHLLRLAPSAMEERKSFIPLHGRAGFEEIISMLWISKAFSR